MDDKTFDQLSAKDWIAAVESGGAAIREADIYPRIRSWIDERSPHDILDIGCGQGVCADKFTLTGRTYTGVDPSAFLIDRAKELYEGTNRTFTVGSAYSLPFANGVFDAAFSVAVWHLLGNLPMAASEIARVLCPGGGFLIVTANPNAYSLWTDRYSDTTVDGRRFHGRMPRAEGSWSRDTLYLHAMEEIVESLKAACLEVEVTEEFRESATVPGSYQYVSLKGRTI